MYDLITSSLLFIVLVPGVLLTVGSGVTAAVIHGIVFYVIQRFVSQFVTWWIIWAAVVGVVAWRFTSTASSSAT